VLGRVEDPTGAGVAGARVRVFQPASGEAREAAAGEDGEFAVTNLAPGVYQVTVEHGGFKRLQRDGVELQIDQQLRLELRLEVGAVTETIEVRAEAALLNTENASKGEVIASQEITEMPLEGRDFNDLSFMVPGVARKPKGGSGGALNINGARSDNTNFLIDGFTNNSMRGGGAQARPPVDALLEYKLQVTGYPAEYGRLAGGVMNMVLKSGTNRFHGTAFEFLRNEALDARNFFDAEKSKLRRNQFGATVHGPVSLGRLYRGRDRTFFLASWESYRQGRGVNKLGRVPAALEQAGDFSETRDPATGKIVALKDPLASNVPFAGNLIPESRWDAVAVKAKKFYPAVNREGQANNFRANANDTDEWDSYLGKIDHKLTEKDQISGRYMLRRADQADPFNGSDTGLFGKATVEDLSLGGVSWTRLWSPAVVQEFRAGFSRQDQRARMRRGGEDWNATLGLPSPAVALAYAFPRITVRDLVSLGNSADQPVGFVSSNIEAGGSLTVVRGKHLMKFGGTGMEMQFFQPSLNNLRGTFNFLGRWTGDPFADFLLGLLNNATRKLQGADPGLTSWNGGLFAQDDWRVARALTLNIGVRYEISLPMKERHGRLANFVPALGKIVLARRGAIPDQDRIIADNGLADKVAYADEAGLPESMVWANRKMFAPRFGFAWRPGRELKTVIRSGYGVFYAGSMTNPVRGDLADVFPFSINQTFNRNTSNPMAVSFQTPFSIKGTIEGVNNSSGMDPFHSPQYMQSWHFTFERDLGGETAAEIAYVGSKGTNLGRRYNVNQPIRDPALRPSGTGGFPRPYAGINDVQYYAFGSNSSYNAGMATWRRRFARGFFFRVNYVYAKSIDDASQLQGAADGGYGGAQDARNLQLERARSDFDTGHTFTMNYSWDAPFRRNRWVRGWQLTGSGRLYSGQPFTAKTSNVQLDQGEANRPDRIAKGRLDERTVERWFDLAAFQTVPAGAFRMGTSGRNILDGPGYVGVNTGLYRRFLVSEGRSLQFRWEVFNIFNRANFELPNGNVNAANGGTITEAQTGRTMQMALKYVF
jgi:hypothetical protein